MWSDVYASPILDAENVEIGELMLLLDEGVDQREIDV
jgi:hypothetical protein